MRKSTLNTHRVAVAGHVKFEMDVIKLYQETGQKYHVFLLKRTTPGNLKNLHMHLINPFKYTEAGILSVSVLFTFNRQLKRRNRIVSKIYSLSLEKRGDPELNRLFYTKTQLIYQNVKIQGQNL